MISWGNLANQLEQWASSKYAILDRPSIAGGGRVWFADFFEDPTLNWQLEGTWDPQNVSSHMARDTRVVGAMTARRNTPFMGSACLRIGSNAIADDERVHVHLHGPPLPELHGVGMELRFNIRDFTNFRKLVFPMRVKQGGKGYDPYIQIYYDGTDYKLQYLDENRNYQDVDTINWLDSRDNIWYPFKMVVDYDEGEYRSVFLAAEEYDLRGKKFPVYDDTKRFFSPGFYIVSSADAIQYAWIDGVIITYGE